jgi:hypothetical protein
MLRSTGVGRTTGISYDRSRANAAIFNVTQDARKIPVVALTAGSGFCYLAVRPYIKQRRRIWIGPVYVCTLYLQAEGPVIGSIDIIGTGGSASLNTPTTQKWAGWPPLWLPRCYFRGISVHEMVIKNSI